MKKRNILFTGIILLLFAIMYYNNRNKPLDFIWKTTYSTDDKQPYGCYVLDEMIAASWDDIYYHSYENISNLETSGDLDDCNLLIICNYFTPSEFQQEDLEEYIKNGGSAFIAAETFPETWLDTLDLGIENFFKFPINLSSDYETTIITLAYNSACDSLRGVPRSMVTTHFIEKDIYTKTYFEGLSVRAYDSKTNPLIVQAKIGEGRLYLCTTPQLFTNYAVLNDSLNPFLRTALSPLKGKPLVRTEYYSGNKHSAKSASLLKYLLSQPSLEWACYIVMGMVILFMIFTAKRKQKTIPVVKPPANKMLEFVRSISMLYLKRNNNADIIMKKYIYWSDDLRRRYGIDIINEHHNKTFIKQFSAKTGMPESEARHLFLEIDGIREHTEVSDEEMLNLITKMKID